MGNEYNRRDILEVSTAALDGAYSLSAGSQNAPAQEAEGGKTIRLGFVGVGDRGSYHPDAALGIPGVEVPALCDIDKAYLYRAKRWVEESGQPTLLYFVQNGRCGVFHGFTGHNYVIKCHFTQRILFKRLVIRMKD